MNLTQEQKTEIIEIINEELKRFSDELTKGIESIFNVSIQTSEKSLLLAEKLEQVILETKVSNTNETTKEIKLPKNLDKEIIELKNDIQELKDLRKMLS